MNLLQRPEIVRKLLVYYSNGIGLFNVIMRSGKLSHRLLIGLFLIFRTRWVLYYRWKF